MHSRFARVPLLAVCFSLALFAQTPTITSVVNSASRGPRIAPGTLVDVIGSGFPTDTASLALVGTTRRATVVSRDSTKWVIQIPFGFPAGQTTVEIGNSAPFTITLADYAPALFSADQTGGGIVSAHVIHSQTSSFALSAGNPARLGDILVLNATGLGPIDVNEANATLEIPSVTIGGISMLVVNAFLTTARASDPGESDTKCLGSFCTPAMYQVIVSLPPAMNIGSDNRITLSVGGQSTEAQVLTVPVSKSPLLNSVVNAASFSETAPLVPGSLATVFGTTFGVENQAAGFPATEFQGISVTFNGQKAPLFFLGTAVRDAYGQINLQVPSELPDSGPVTVQVTTRDGVSNEMTVQMAPAAPGVFYFYSERNQQRHNAVALVQETMVQGARVQNTMWLVVPDDLAQEGGLQGNCRAGNVSTGTWCGEPARPGDTILVYATGMGRAYPNGDASQLALPTGQTAPENPQYRTVANPVVTIGNVPATVTGTALVPGAAGVFVITVVVPTNAPAGDDVPVVVRTTNDQQDTTTTIAIRQ